MNEKEYKYNKTYTNLFLGLGVLCILFIFIMFVISKGRVLPLNIGLIMPIIAYFLFKNFTVLKFYDTYVEVKIAPLRGVQMFRYNELESIETEKNKMIIYPKNGKKIKLALVSFDKDQRSEVIELLKSKVG